MSKSAPGKHFRKGMSLVEIMRMFPDDAAAEKWFVERRWPDGVTCPCCGSVNVQTRPTRKPQPYRCRDCRKDFSTKTGTLMQGSKLGFQTWAVAIYLMATSLKSVSSMKLHRDLGVTQKTAWFLAQRIRETWTDNASPFSGPVEADETYMGGKRKNMSNAKRKALREAGVGRGAGDKHAIVGTKDRATNRVAAQHVLQTDMPHVAGFVADQAKIGATVYTDEAAVYGALKPWYDHETVNHSTGEYVRGRAHTNGIESFWSMLKRAYHGTFHKLSPKHLQRYVDEFAGKHNVRDADTIDQMRHVVAGMAGKRLTYAELIADNGLSSGARS